MKWFDASKIVPPDETVVIAAHKDCDLIQTCIYKDGDWYIGSYISKNRSKDCWDIISKNPDYWMFLDDLLIDLRGSFDDKPQIKDSRPNININLDPALSKDLEDLNKRVKILERAVKELLEEVVEREERALGEKLVKKLYEYTKENNA